MPLERSTYNVILTQVDKPGRYLGNERGAVKKDPATVSLRVALAFPEVYEIAQSHAGLQILYDLLNRRSDVYAERAYAPWLDAEVLLRRHGQPLASLETLTPLRDFHIVGFSLQYELTYTNLLMMLDLGGIPLLTKDRDSLDPLIVAGGPCAFNPEPLADVLDAVLLGDGEEAIHDLCDVYLRWDRRDRAALLAAMARIPGVYVPSFYVPTYAADGALDSVRPIREDIPPVVTKRVLRDLDTVPLQETFVVPNLRVVHARPSLEVMRGCVKGCRFCQAGYVYRPLRERDPRRLVAQAERAVAATGTDELSLLSLSTGDYSCVNPLLTELMNRFADRQVAVSLPSTRVDALAPSLLEQIRRVRKTGFTLAPEAGTQRLRNLIQKEFHEDELIEAARQIFALGWRSLKLYFMTGLPGETEADLVGIAELASKVAATAPRRAEVTVALSTFVPKPHTPFQWAPQIDVPEIEARQSFLRRELHRRGLRFKWHDARASLLEGVFSRGDRRTGALLHAAYRLGCRFDGWTESCRMDLWETAARETRIDLNAHLARKTLDAPLPWDHLDAGVTKGFLHRELARAADGILTPDCSVERCTNCGACDFTRIRNVDYHLAGAKGAEHRGQQVDAWARATVPAAETPGAWEPRGWQKIRARMTAPTARCRAVDTPATAAVFPEAAPRDDAHSSEGIGAADEWLAAPRQPLAPPARPPSAPSSCRLRVTYRKLARARYISHLELLDVITGVLRRSRLPVAFSQGHRPAHRVRFSPGLPVGVESDCETLDIDLTETLACADVARRLDEEFPEGLSVAAVQEIPLRAPSIETELIGFRYRLHLGSLLGADGGEWIDARFARFRDAAAFPLSRHTGRGVKTIDARPLVARLARTAPASAELDIRFSPAGSLKPIEFVAAVLELEEPAARAVAVRKTACFFRQPPADPARADAPPLALDRIG